MTFLKKKKPQAKGEPPLLQLLDILAMWWLSVRTESGKTPIAWLTPGIESSENKKPEFTDKEREELI